MDRFDLYELCVQNPPVLAALLRQLHGQNPTRLAEDFCGTAALSREWVRSDPPTATVACLDADAAVISEAQRRATSESCDVARMRFTIANAVDAPLTNSIDAGADIIFVGNFSIGELHERPTLLRYLIQARARLRSGGIFVCDTYAGESAWRTGALRRVRHVHAHEACSGNTTATSTRVHYTWEQRTADPFTARVVNALHFRVEQEGEIVQEFTDAFVYHWRVWSVPELRDAMADAGFASTEFHTNASDPSATNPSTPKPASTADAFAACVVART